MLKYDPVGAYWEDKDVVLLPLVAALLAVDSHDTVAAALPYVEGGPALLLQLAAAAAGGYLLHVHEHRADGRVLDIGMKIPLHLAVGVYLPVHLVEAHHGASRGNLLALFVPHLEKLLPAVHGSALL